jgi:trk system potassium uptake protein TrkA
VVRNYNPRWLPMHEAFGLQVVSSTAWGAQRIEELLYQPLGRTVFSAGNGEVEVYELVVPEAWRGRRIGDLLAGTESVPVAVTRAGRSTLPSPETPLEPSDIVHVSATLAGIEALRERAAPSGGPR